MSPLAEALCRAMEYADHEYTRDRVSLRARDWHALCDAARVIIEPPPSSVPLSEAHVRNIVRDELHRFADAAVRAHR